MDDGAARLALLQGELASIESSIRGFDAIAFQVKGWCVTTSLAIAGIAVTGHQQLILIGAGSVLGFWLLDSQNRSIQRVFIDRAKTIRENIRKNGIAKVLAGHSDLAILGSPDVVTGAIPSRGHFRLAIGRYTHRILYEAVQVHTMSLYLFLLTCLCVEALIIWT
jgi:hypothetical protein